MKLSVWANKLVLQSKQTLQKSNLQKETVLKVSKFRKQIMVPKLVPKKNQAHYPGRLLLKG